MSDGSISVSARTLRRVGIGVAVAVAVVITGIVGWQFRDRLDLGGVFARGAGDQIDRATYQAVFLTGGQLYFGRLATRGDDYFLLSDVYYLPADDKVSPAPADRPARSSSAGTSTGRGTS